MKIFKSLLILVVALSLVSCGNDDDSNNNNPQLVFEDFAGTYSLKFLETTEIETTIVNGGTIVTRTESEGDTFTNSDFIFTANGTYTFNVSYRITETVTVTGNPPQTDSFIFTDQGSGSYSLNEDNNTVTLNGDVFTAARFTNDELRLTFSDAEIDGDSTIESSGELRFDR